MPIYTAEINGRGIAAFDAADLVAAEDWAHGTVFLEDLFRLETDGAAFWDGVAEIYVRPALPEEEAKWQASWDRALLRGDVEEGWRRLGRAGEIAARARNRACEPLKPRARHHVIRVAGTSRCSLITGDIDVHVSIRS